MFRRNRGQRLRDRADDNFYILPLREIIADASHIEGVGAPSDSLRVPLHDIGLFFREDIALVDPRKRIEKVELSTGAIPTQQIHNRGTHEAAIDATLNEVTHEFRR